MFKLSISIIIFHLLCIILIECKVNKYSAEANIGFKKDSSPTVPLKTLDKPFRMSKINKLWSKAQVHGLSETKLKSLYRELTLQDKEELTWKRMKLEGKDKEGLKEAKLRKKLLGIMDNYGLLAHFEEISTANKAPEDSKFNEAVEKRIGKSLFKDKKLNKLWASAENAGFTTVELEALREEFSHHQDKIDEYYMLLHDVKEGGQTDQHENSIDEKLELFNTINKEAENEESENPEPEKKDYLDKVNLVREKHHGLRDGYDRLYRLSAKGPESKEFVEPKVQGLWRIALESNFETDELDSLRIELMHYENRLLKLRHLQSQALANERHKEKMVYDKTDQIALLVDNIRKHSRKVEKIHLDLETRIMQKHIEL